jgi:3-oxosteroid 1-dehydrogenase
LTRVWQDKVDLLILGSGAASIIAALVAKRAGKRALIIEKTDRIGGSTALSGGVVWIPNNPVMRRDGIADSFEDAWNYLEACARNGGRGATPERRRAFLSEAPNAIEFLEQHGMKFQRSDGYSDYHETEYPGGSERGRTLVAKLFDLRELGAWRERLRQFPGPHIPVNVAESRHVARNGVTFQSKWMYARIGMRLLRRKFGVDLVARGAALQGRLLGVAVKHGVEFWTDTQIREFAMDAEGSVEGVILDRAGKAISVGAGAVLVNTGGFARNAGMRARYGPQPSSTKYSIANPGDTGEVMEKVIEMGAATDNMDLAWWLPTSIDPDGGVHFHNPMGISKPHTIMVDGTGMRYVNEATSYVAIGMAMYERHKTVPAVPSWIIQDSVHRAKYRSGANPVGPPPEHWVTTGYIKRADTIEALAEQCGIEPAALAATVERFNGFARTGVDADFGKGRGAYHRFLGDPTWGPNSNLGPIERPPFYAIAVYPGDVGTAGGLVTDEKGRVLKADGQPIGRLYATGNATASVVGRSYPGAGASIGASLVFGYIAASDAVAARHQP